MSTTPNLDAMVSRFLAWRLPDDFCPDGFVYFGKGDAKHYGWPTGTNLLNAEQARKMLEHVVGADASPKSMSVQDVVNFVAPALGAMIREVQAEAATETAPDQRPKTEAVPSTTGETAENKQLADQFVEPSHLAVQRADEPNMWEVFPACARTGEFDYMVELGGGRRLAVRLGHDARHLTAMEQANLRPKRSEPPRLGKIQLLYGGKVVYDDLKGWPAEHGPMKTKTYPDGTQATGAAPLPEVAPTADADGWITWGGGECPVDQNQKVEIKLRSGLASDSDPASAWIWSHFGGAGDIIAYRVVQQPAEPAAQDDDWKPNKPIPHRVKITGNGTMGGTFIRDSTTGEPIRCVQSYTITQEKGQLAHAVINVVVPEVDLECDAEIRVVKGGA